MFGEKLLAAQREVRDLKTSHEMKSTMRTWAISWHGGESSNYIPIHLRLTFVEGTQPILTTIIGVPEMILLAPTDTTQDCWWLEKTGTSQVDTTFIFISTRKILSIEEISTV